MTISGATLKSNLVTYFRDLLLSGVTDPVSGTRPSNSEYVMTTYGTRPVKHPYITVDCRKTGEIRGGLRSEATIGDWELEVRIWSKSKTQADKLYDEVYQYFRRQQTGAGLMIDDGIYGFRQTGENTIVEGSGKQAVKSNLLFYTFKYVVI